MKPALRLAGTSYRHRVAPAEPVALCEVAIERTGPRACPRCLTGYVYVGWYGPQCASCGHSTPQLADTQPGETRVAR